MKKTFCSLAIAGLIGAMASLPGYAGDNDKPYKAVEHLLTNPKTVIGETIYYPGGVEAKITSSIVTIMPGDQTKWHKHGAPLYAYVISGVVTVDYGDKGKKVYPAGTDLMEAMDQWHRGENHGAEPARILAVHLGAEGVENTILKD